MKNKDEGGLVPLLLAVFFLGFINVKSHHDFSSFNITHKAKGMKTETKVL